MINAVNVSYAQSGSSVNTNELGMREMQQRVYEHRSAQHLLIKAPPASGKSRALMFVALDKLFNQGVRKVIVAVPERSIGQSFASTDLTSHGFFADWTVDPANNLCTPGSDSGKIQAFTRFLENSTDTVLVCTHATLRFAYEKLTAADFNNVLVAIDEFHHVSADLEKSNLGALIHDLLKNSTAHIVAMTGSYFRGDRVPVLSPETEAKFTPVTFNYYDQLNGYRHLKTLGIGHHFYQGTWYDSLEEVLDPDKKTILHIPHVGSAESTKDKYEEVNRVLDAIGTVESVDEATGVLTVRRKDNGGTLKVADLVDDSDLTKRARILDYLTTVVAQNRDGIDIIIALGMAKEGFDWPYAEHALTVGYRASLTEIIQIIGRVTRDSEGKAHAQFTNLIAQPDDAQDEVTVAVNNVLKAITASLLMEQVLAENFSFKNRAKPDDTPEHPGQLLIEGFKEPTTARTQQIIDMDLNDLKATVLQSEKLVRAAAAGVDPEVINKEHIPGIIRERYPDLNATQVEEVRQALVVDSVVKNGDIKTVGDNRFIMMQHKFVNVNELNINLIDSVNPFQRAYEIISKNISKDTLRVISNNIAAGRIEVTEEEARITFPKIQRWVKLNGRRPNLRADDPVERRYAEIALWLQREGERRKREAAQRQAEQHGQDGGAQ